MKIAHLNKYWCVWVHVSSIAQHSLTGLIIPFQLGDKVLDDLHDNHPEIVYMKALARSCVWCPGMEKRIKEKSASHLSSTSEYASSSTDISLGKCHITMRKSAFRVVVSFMQSSIWKSIQLIQKLLFHYCFTKSFKRSMW